MNQDAQIFQSVEAFYNTGGTMLAGTQRKIQITGVVGAMSPAPFSSKGKTYRWFILTDDPATKEWELKVVLQGIPCQGFEKYANELVTIEGFVNKDDKAQTPNAVKIGGARLISTQTQDSKPDTPLSSPDTFQKNQDQKSLSIVRQVILKAAAEVYPKVDLSGGVIASLKKWFDDVKLAAQESGIEDWLLGNDNESEPF